MLLFSIYCVVIIVLAIVVIIAFVEVAFLIVVIARHRSGRGMQYVYVFEQRSVRRWP